MFGRNSAGGIALTLALAHACGAKDASIAAAPPPATSDPTAVAPALAVAAAPVRAERPLVAVGA